MYTHLGSSALQIHDLRYSIYQYDFFLYAAFQARYEQWKY